MAKYGDAGTAFINLLRREGGLADLPNPFIPDKDMTMAFIRMIMSLFTFERGGYANELPKGPRGILMEPGRIDLDKD